MKKNASQRGSAMMLVVVMVLILVGISGAYMSISWWNAKRAYQDEAAAQALYIAESGAAIYVTQLNAVSAPLPTKIDQQFLGGGFYWVPQENIVDFGNAAVVGANNVDPNYASFQVAAKYNGITRRLDVILSHKIGGPLASVLWAGNKSGDKGYALQLTGSLANNTEDIARGNVYTGQDFSATGDAQLLDQNGKAPGKVTYKNNNSSTVTGPNFVQGSEPDLQINRNFGPSNSELEAEYLSGKFNGGRDPSTGVAWVDVAGQFDANAAKHTWVDGSTAMDIMDPNNPAHMFRQNPSSIYSNMNRTQAYEYTIPSTSVANPRTGKPRSDYYVEDPTSKTVTAPSLTGVPVNGDTTASMLNVQPNGNNAVYYIDGNMRVSGEPIKSYQFNPQAGTGDIKMTFVVKGNVSLTDNLLYPSWESTTDAIAIVAVKDADFPNTTPADFVPGAVSGPLTPAGTSANAFVAQYNARAGQGRKDGLNMPDIDLSTLAGQIKASQEYNKVYGSGNIYFGDPGSGTVEHFEGFLYAENNFYATNLDTTMKSGGTSKLEVFGNMTAGNQVSVDRVVRSDGGYAGYMPLHAIFDPKLQSGRRPPGLPPDGSTASLEWHIVSWKQSAMTAEAKQK
jgi:hypothetical protein